MRLRRYAGPMIASLLLGQALLLGATSLAPQDAPEATDRTPVLVVSGANNHDWEWTTPSLARILERSGRFDVDVTYRPSEALAEAGRAGRYAAFVLDYNGPNWEEPARDAFLAAVRGGAGVVVVHAADNSGRGWPEYEALVGDLWREGTGHGRFHAFDVEITDRDHPVTRTLPTILQHPDELYHRLVHVEGVERRVLATAYSDPATGGTGDDEPMIMVGSYGEGRVFHTPLGHVWKGVATSQASHRDPQFQGLIVRGTEWAATGAVTDAATAPRPLTDEERAAGWVDLMDPALWGAGDGWTFDGDVVRCGPDASDLATKREWSDFVLEFQWKTVVAGETGVAYRPSGTDPRAEMQLANVHADLEGEARTSGALEGLVPAQPVVRPAPPWGEFRSARIVARGRHLEHWVDGELVLEQELDDAFHAGLSERGLDLTAGTFASNRGPIVLRGEGHEAWFRGLRLLPIDGDGWEPLFTDAPLAQGWTNVGDATYEIDGDTLIGRAGPRRRQSFLVSREVFGDFELEVDVKMITEGNSGIQIRSHVTDGRLRGYQAEIDPTDRRWSGGIYDEGRRGWLDGLEGDEVARAAFDKAGWNRYRIRCIGPHVQVWVNGVQTADLLDGADLTGHIAFQIHGGDDDIEIGWRGARVRRLGAHTWTRQPSTSMVDAAEAEGPGLRMSVLGAGSLRLVELPDTEVLLTLDLGGLDGWREDSSNELAVLAAGGRTVVQVSGRTAASLDREWRGHVVLRDRTFAEWVDHCIPRR